jgi:hypothetical protein
MAFLVLLALPLVLIAAASSFAGVVGLVDYVTMLSAIR